MAADHARRQLPKGVEFYEEEDGSITAHDLESGRSRGGETRGEALRDLAEVLVLEEGGGDPIQDEETFLREIGIDPEEVPDDSEPLPDFMS